MGRKKPDLSIIILNYNTKDFLKDCLASIKRAKKDSFSFETIVIDNASTDGSVEFIKELKSSRVKELNISLIKNKPVIELIESKKNVGFAAGNNLGIPKANGRYLLFLNPDTKVLANTLEVMLKFMDRHPRAGAATCRVELPNGQLDEACHRGFPTPWNAFCHFLGLGKAFPKVKFFSGYSLGYLPLNKVHEIDSGVGAFLMVRREAGNQIGWWDEDYFWYGEDLDFCYRLKKKDWKIFFVPQVKIIHYKGAASGIKKHSGKISTATKETQIRSARSSTEVMRIFYQKHYLNRYPKALAWLVMKGIDLLEKIRLLKASL